MYSVFASPVVYEQSCREDALGQNRVAVIRDASGDVVGVCPIVRSRLEMPFIVRRYQFGKFVLEAATILSRVSRSFPMTPPSFGSCSKVCWTSLIVRLHLCRFHPDRLPAVSVHLFNRVQTVTVSGLSAPPRAARVDLS